MKFLWAKGKTDSVDLISSRNNEKGSALSALERVSNDPDSDGFILQIFIMGYKSQWNSFSRVLKERDFELKFYAKFHTKGNKSSLNCGNKWEILFS